MSLTAADLFDYTKGAIDPTKFAFGAPKKSNVKGVSGVSIPITYAGKKLVIRTPALVAPFGMTFGFGKELDLV